MHLKSQNMKKLNDPKKKKKKKKLNFLKQTFK